VLWTCEYCAADANVDLHRVEPVPDVEMPLPTATPELVVERGSILALIEALEEPDRQDLLAAVASARPTGVPQILWRPTSVLWRDAAIVAYRVLLAQEEEDSE
jgi:hypothetical protein